MRDSEARFRELADTTPALMWMTDAEGDVTFVNEGWLRFTGRTLSEELGDTFGMSAHPDDRAELLADWRAAVARRAEFRFEYRLTNARGGHRWVLEVGTPRFAEGEFVGYVGTATDIDERKGMEDALRESEASFRELADSAPVMIWTTDERGLVTFVNEGWLRYTGTTLEEELGHRWTLGVHPEDAPAVLATWNERLARREAWEHEYRLRGREGDYRWIVDRGVPRYEGGRFAGYVGTAIDIHERKTMEARLREVYEREHTIAETLQRSLLPERLPRIEGLEIAARYLPAARGTAIGGDWYDALERPDGRVALVVGDVVGHGLRAATFMGQLRNAFRAYGVAEASPAEVMARVNRLVLSGDEEAMATVLYLVLDRETGEIRFASAGHPPPLVLAPDGVHFLEGGRSVPIGAAEPGVFREATAVLPPGASLLLYTDGLVERRDVPLERRLDELADAAGRAEGELEGLCDHVLGAVLGEQVPSDDVALLAVRRRSVAGERMRVSLPAEPESLARPAAPARPLPGGGGGERRGDLRDHADRLRGRRQRDRARLRAGRCHLRGGGRDAGRGARGHRARQRHLARPSRHSPRARPQDHRGPHGRGGGLDGIHGYRCAHEKAAGCVTTAAEIAIERHAGTVVAQLSGEVDMTNAAYVREEIVESVPNDALALIIDLGGCRYLDSAAIEVIFDLSRRLARRRQELRLVLPAASPLRRVLELTEVASVAAVHDSLDSALA